MKLIYVTTMFPCGPKEAFFLPEIAELQRQGHSVTVIPLRPRSQRVHGADVHIEVIESSLLSLEILVFACLSAFHAPIRTVRAAAMLLRSRSLLILLKNVLGFPKALWLARKATQLRADHIHVQWAATTATAGMIASVVSGIPWSFTAHRWDIRENNLIAAKMRSAGIVRAISRRGASQLGDLCPDRTSIIHLGRLGVEVPRDVAAPRVARDSLCLVTIANLVEVKGHKYLIDAIAGLQSSGHVVKVEFVGDGPLRDELERTVEERQLADLVSFKGVVPHEALLEMLRSGRWDGVILPSIRTATGEEEGVPVALMEAMAAGVPVISTHTGAIDELVSGAGLLVPDRDPAALQGAIATLFDRGSAATLAMAGRARILKEYEVSGTVQRFMDLLGGATVGHKPTPPSDPHP